MRSLVSCTFWTSGRTQADLFRPILLCSLQRTVAVATGRVLSIRNEGSSADDCKHPPFRTDASSLLFAAIDAEWPTIVEEELPFAIPPPSLFPQYDGNGNLLPLHPQTSVIRSVHPRPSSVGPRNRLLFLTAFRCFLQLSSSSSSLQSQEDSRRHHGVRLHRVSSRLSNLPVSLLSTVELSSSLRFLAFRRSRPLSRPSMSLEETTQRVYGLQISVISWCQKIPSTAHPSSLDADVLTLAFHHATLLLHRPSPVLLASALL